MPIRLRHYLDDYDDLEEAHRAYLADLEALGTQGNGAAAAAFRLATGLQDHTGRLNRAFEQGHVPAVLSPSWRADVRVFVGDAGKRFWTRRFGGRAAVVIDLDLVVRLVLLIYMIGIDKEEDVVAQALASLLLLSIVVPRDEDFPRLFDLLWSAAGRDGRVINDLFSLAGDFVLFHEIGHSYVSRFGANFARVAFRLPPGVSLTPEVVRSLRVHPDGPIFNQMDLPGTQNGLLILAPKYERWVNEFASDVFAVYAGVLAPAGGRPGAEDLERFADALACWQHLLYAIGWREQYMRSITGEADSAAFSHPMAHTRMDIVLHHINYLAEEFAPHWLKSPALARFKAHYDSLWAADLARLVAEGIEYVRYAFDEEGPHINQGRVFTPDGRPVPHVPSLLSRFGEYFLAPFLAEVERVGWDRAVRDDRERHVEYFQGMHLNDRPVILDLGRRLHDVDLRLISEDR